MYATRFQNNKFEAECPQCLEWTDDGEFLEAFGYCRKCDENRDFWLDKLALGRLV